MNEILSVPWPFRIYNQGCGWYRFHGYGLSSSFWIRSLLISVSWLENGRSDLNPHLTAGNSHTMEENQLFFAVFILDPVLLFRYHATRLSSCDLVPGFRVF